MIPRLVHDSLATRLVAVLLLGGVLLSAGIAAIEWSRSGSSLALEVTQRSALAVGNIRSVVRADLTAGRTADLDETLAGFRRSELIKAVRVTGPTGVVATTGAWPAKDATDEPTLWAVGEHPMLSGDEVSIAGLTLARGTMTVRGQPYLLEVLLDGQRAAGGVWRRTWESVAWALVLIGAVLLLLVVLLRRWVERPMADLTRLVSVDAGSGEFERWASVQSSDIGGLADAMGRMLERVETARATLDRRERENESLFRDAPVAMLSVTAEGRVTHANQRAAQMFSESETKYLIGRGLDELVAEEDRPRLWAAVERAGFGRGQRVELRLTTPIDADDDTPRWVVVESTPITDSADSLIGLRLCFIDVTDAVRLRGELESQTRLLNLLIDHMSDAILLVDSDGRIAAANQQLAALFGRPASSLLDSRYDPAMTWEPLGLVDEDAFVERLGRVEADNTNAFQARFETRAGAFIFRGVAVHGDDGAALGRLWVVQETTSQEQGQRMLIEQNQRLAAMRRVATALSGVWRFEDVTTLAVSRLREELGVDAVGMAVRRSDEGRRCHQLIHRGDGPMGLSEHRALAEFVEQRLLPRTMNGSQTLHWAELTGGSDYGEAFGGIGLTTAAACALTGSDDVVGVLWAGARAGEGLQRHQLLMLETIAPLIAARLEVAGQVSRLSSLGLLDAETYLLNHAAFERLAERMRDEARPWGLVRAVVDARDGDAAGVDWRSLIAAVSRVIRRSTQVGRLDDGSLVLALPGVDAGHAAAAADRVSDSLTPWLGSTGHTARVGWASAPDDGQDLAGLASRSLDRATPIAAARAAA